MAQIGKYRETVEEQPLQPTPMWEPVRLPVKEPERERELVPAGPRKEAVR